MNLLLLTLSIFLVFKSLANDSISHLVVGATGTSMYICNAGIRHSGIANLDFLNATYADYIDNQTPLGATTTTEVGARDSLSTFNTLFADEATSFKQQIVGLTINHQSEFFGSEYFVDFCYRGPNVQINNGSNYTLRGDITLTNLRASSLPSYQLMANLEGRAEAKCMLEKPNGILTTVSPGVDPYNYFKSSGSTYVSMNLSASQIMLLSDSGLLNVAGEKVPRYCIVRYFFRENSTAIRKWRWQQVRLAINTDISDKNGN